DNAIVALALGVDMISVGREAMLAIGCIQAQKCHTDTCPTGVATQDKWLAHGLDPTLKSVRAASYIKTLRRDLLKVAEHPDALRPADPQLAEESEAGRVRQRPHGSRIRQLDGAPLFNRHGTTIVVQHMLYNVSCSTALH
ncbi:MAG: glutamate synthase-related protein, partial [Actinomycetota bacterium]|nr:glutamate synthase-related protein [Actinomycetota bacterium]